MTLIIENSFSLNNYISISNRIIKNIPYYYLYFFPVIQYKNLDQKFKILISSNSNLVNKDIFYKLLYFHHNKFYSFKLSDTYFSKNLYHIFFSLNILRKNHISFLIDDDSLIFLNNDHQLPLLHNYSYSFYFPIININNLYW